MNNKNHQATKIITKCSSVKRKMQRMAIFLTLLSLFFIVQADDHVKGVSPQCMPDSFYNTHSWTWSIAGPCDANYNCLAYALGNTRDWVWPWGYSSPTSTQVAIYLQKKGYYTYGYNPKIISYGLSTSSILHFSKVTGSSTCRAKWGELNLVDHGSWDPYYPNSIYGSKRSVYYGTRYPLVTISGPTNVSGEAFYKWIATVSYGTSPYSYKWYKYTPSTSYTLIGTSGSYYYFGEFYEDFRLDVEVTDAAGYKTYDSIYVTVGGTSGDDPIMYKKQSDYERIQIDANISAVLETAKDNNIVSANPYDYIDSHYFGEIVRMGPGVLMKIREEILISRQSGLREYLLAIAAEEIAGVNLKGKSAKWEDAKGFCRTWDEYMRTLPTTIAEIIASDDSIKNKNKALVKLGLPAIPFIVDEVASGKTEFNEALKILAKTSPFLSTKKAGENLGNWKKKNNDLLKVLRDLNATYKH